LGRNPHGPFLFFFLLWLAAGHNSARRSRGELLGILLNIISQPKFAKTELKDRLQC
jgi:hypothetical protein